MTTKDAASIPAACPLLSAILPLRYAIGPTTAVDTSAYGLPALEGNFPDLGETEPELAHRSLNYTARLLRDGWLYVWQSGLSKLVEYSVSNAMLSQTPRGGKVIDGRKLPYVLVPAGEEAMLVWSPTKWSDAQFASAKANAAVRQRVMRSITPGAAPFSGSVSSIHERIGDYMDANAYGWSCAPKTSHRTMWQKLLADMQRCEQQGYALIDDAWGVLMDLALLLRKRQETFNQRRHVRGDDWAMAGVLKSLADSDKQIAAQLPSITRYSELTAALREQNTEENAFTTDIRRLSGLWVDWFKTQSVTGPYTMDTACGHFDITQATAREELELHFASACLCPATTSQGAKAIADALNAETVTGKPWLLWSLLGVAKRMGIGEISSLVGLTDGVASDSATLMAQASAWAQSANAAAEKLAPHVDKALPEALFTALAPVAGLGLQRGNEATKAVGQLYMAASLARSQQRLAVEMASPRQMGEWLSDLMGTRPSVPAHIKPTQLSVAVSEALPFFRLMPARNLPPLVGKLAADVNLKDMLSLGKEALESAPLKCLVVLVAAVNFVWGGGTLISSPSAKGFVNVLGGTAGLASAISAVTQKVYEARWEKVVTSTHTNSYQSQISLTAALGVGAVTSAAQSITSALDALIYGVEAFEAYQQGDLDTATINASLAFASAANLRLYVQSFRAIRAARAAVIAGDAAALARGVSVVPHLAVRALGWTILIVGGVLARLYTQDTPLEAWVKQTSFGIRPADWSKSHAESMTEFYKIIFPISFQAYRLNELNPYHGHRVNTYLLLRLPGKSELTDEMIHFKGHEVWDSFLGLAGTKKKVEWTGKDFDAHIGTRIDPEPGIAAYRRVYHESKGEQFDGVRGELSYSPMEGLTLPPIEIKEVIWL